MKRLIMGITLAVFGWIADTQAQQLRYISIDGTVNPPVITGTNLANADRPAITRNSAGFYTIDFRFTVRFFNGDAQAGGPGRDAASLIFTSRYDTLDRTKLDIVTYAVSSGPPVTMTPQDGRLSIIVVR